MSLKFLESLTWFRAWTTIVALESADLKKIEIVVDTHYTNPTGTAIPLALQCVEGRRREGKGKGESGDGSRDRISLSHKM